MDPKSPSLRARPTRTSLRLDGNEGEQAVWQAPIPNNGTPSDSPRFTSTTTWSTNGGSTHSSVDSESHLPTPEGSVSDHGDHEEDDVFSTELSATFQSKAGARGHRLSFQGSPRTLPPEERRISLSLEQEHEPLLQSLRKAGRNTDSMMVKFYMDMRQQGKVRSIPKEVESIIIRDEQERVQKKTFTNWINSYLKQYEPPTRMEDLFEDIKDGIKLIILLEVLSSEKIPKKKKVPTATLR